LGRRMRGKRRKLVVGRVLPTTVRSSSTAGIGIAWSRRLKAELSTECHDPFMLEQLDCAGSLVRIAVEAFLQEVNARLTELVARR